MGSFCIFDLFALAGSGGFWRVLAGFGGSFTFLLVGSLFQKERARQVLFRGDLRADGLPV
jgi:hypothetical protein